MLWIIGKTGLLAQAFQRILAKHNTAHIATSKEECNIASKDSIKAFIQEHSIHTIINCSGYAAVDLAEKEEEKAFAINYQGVASLAELAQEKKIKFVHFSTDYVFNGMKTTPYVEEDKADPLNIYGKSKYMGEQAVLGLCPEALVLRISWLFGLEAPASNFTWMMIQKMQEKESLQVVFDQVSKPTYTDDIVHTVFKILHEKGLFHLANHGRVSRYEFALEILELLQQMQTPVVCQNIIAVPGDAFKVIATRPKYSALDTTQLEKRLQQPLRHHKEALQEYLLALKMQGRI